MNKADNSLTLDEIDVILSQQKTRGEYKPFIARFIESGEVYTNLSEAFPGKIAASLRNSVKLNLDKNFQEFNGRLTVVGDGDDAVVLLINMDAYAAAKQAEQA